jgi:alpha-L-rhamnosidase
VATIRYAGAAGFGSILMDRGDRISWTGDAHLAQKAALAGFGGSFGSEMVRANTERTKKVDNGIISYDMYFVLSAVDYFMHTADAASLSSWAPLIEAKFVTSVAFFAKPKRQGFCGSDDRIGADFENSPPSEAEKSRYYKQLSIQTARAYAQAVSLCSACNASVHAGATRIGALLSSKFEAERGLLNKTCTDEFTECYGMHAATNAVLTGLTTPAEERRIYATLLSNPAHVCSFSPFNSYFILEAMSRLRLQGGRTTAMRAALSMVRRCFHGMTRLGATTYWETYSPEWNQLNMFVAGAPTPNSQTGYMSHCHPWASGAAPWLTHRVLGLRPETPGWRNFSVMPFLDPAAPNFLSSVRGVQTLEAGGEIRVRFACNGSSAISVPVHTVASLVALPLCGGKAASLRVGGQAVPGSSLEHGDDSVRPAFLPLVHY